MLQIFDVMNDGKLIAVEISDGRETWFYAFDQARFPSLRIGKFPCDSTGKNFQRIRYEIKPAATGIQETIENTKNHIPDYEKIGAEIGCLVTEKQAAYGDSFGKSGDVLRILYPDSIKPDQYDDALAVVRIVDKLFRIANNKDAFGESPYVDLTGYSILGVAREREMKSI